MSDRLQLILDSNAMEAFRTHCRSDLASEMCGLFVLRAGVIEFVACPNSAYDIQNSFLIHPVDFVRCMDSGDVIGVGHSHVTDPARPSTEDKTNSENCKLPFVIYQPHSDETDSYDPTGATVSLIGRRWNLGVSDCYSLVQDYYRPLGVALRDYVRNERDCLYKDNRFLELYEENGFVDVTGQTPKIHDSALIQVLSDIPNHMAVFVTDDMILHHLQGRLSCRDPYGGYWARHTNKLLRHKTWL